MKKEGNWAALGSGLSSSHTASDITISPLGEIVFAGNFTSAGGVSDTEYLAKWNKESQVWEPFATGTPDSAFVTKMTWDGLGNLYIVGDFSGVNSVANTARIAKWTRATDTWSSLTPSGAVDAAIRDILIKPNGNIVVTGQFTTIDGVSASRIAEYDGTTWTAFGGGLDNTGWTLAFSTDGFLYVGGDFLNADSVSVNRIAFWDGSTFVGLEGGADNRVSKLMFASNGLLYLGGIFENLDSQSMKGIGVWNGLKFSAMGLGFRVDVSTPPTVVSISEGSDGNIFVAGHFKEDGEGIQEFATGMAIWNGYVWVHLDLGGVASIGSALFLDIDNIYISFAGTSAESSAHDSVANDGTVRAYPKIRFHREGGTLAHVKWIKNMTNGAILWLDHQLQDGEVLLIDLTPGSKSVESSIFGPKWSAIIIASDLDSFFMDSGGNTFQVYVETSGAPEVNCTLLFKNRFWSMDGSDV